MLAESERAMEENSETHDAKKRKTIIQNYVRALIPPALRAAPLNNQSFKDSPEMYDDTEWVSLPQWALNHVTGVLPYFEKESAYREMYLFLRIYKKLLEARNHDIYYAFLGTSSYALGRNRECIAALTEIADRKPEQEYTLLRAYLGEKDWENFQNEFLNFVRKNPEVAGGMKNFIVNEPLVKYIPENALHLEIKELFEVPEGTPLDSEIPLDEP
jgi:hypothetical protein